MIQKNQTVGAQDNVTVVEFGTGDVCITTGLVKESPEINVLLIMSQDAPKDIPQWGPVDEPNITIEQLPNAVVLAFTKVESIDSLIGSLFDARKRLCKKLEATKS